MTITRYEVRPDTGAADLHPDTTVYCVWDTQSGAVCTMENGTRFGQAQQDYAQEMADFLNAGPVSIHEDSSGAVYLTRDGVTWALGPVTPDMYGQAARTAWAWCAGDWEPNEGDGQTRADDTDLTLIATWHTVGSLLIETDQHGEPVAGAGGRAYLGSTSS